MRFRVIRNMSGSTGDWSMFHRVIYKATEPRDAVAEDWIVDGTRFCIVQLKHDNKWWLTRSHGSGKEREGPFPDLRAAAAYATLKESR